MQNIAEFFSKTWVAINDALANTTLQWILLIGCGLLAIALLVLTLTRWGHARPIWKCVVLSVVAHLLLIGYMYGTQLISRAPICLLYTSPSPRDLSTSRMPSSA